MMSLCNFCAPLCLCGEISPKRFHHRDTEIAQRTTERALFKALFAALLVMSIAVLSFAQDQTKRNDRPQEQPSPTPQRREENKKPPDPTRYSYEFNQPQFVISHILIEHDALAR